jgi:hypothetical protein
MYELVNVLNVKVCLNWNLLPVVTSISADTPCKGFGANGITLSLQSIRSAFALRTSRDKIIVDHWNNIGWGFFSVNS